MITNRGVKVWEQRAYTVIYGHRKKEKIMSNNSPSLSKPRAPSVLKDLYKQAAELGVRQKVPAQTKLTLDEQGLGLRLSTGTQLEEPKQMKKKKSSFVKSKATKTKHNFGSTMQNMQDIKKRLGAVENNETEDDDSKQAVMRKENDDPNTTTKHENPNLAPHFVVDLLTKEICCDQESVQSPACSTATFLGGWESGAGGWANTPENWARVFQARSTEGGADFFVDRRALGQVVSSLFRDLASEFSAAKNSGREY
jgi:hypothetical protein